MGAATGVQLDGVANRPASGVEPLDRHDPTVWMAIAHRTRGYAAGQQFADIGGRLPICSDRHNAEGGIESPKISKA